MIKVYTGSEVNVSLLKDILDKNGIWSNVRNEYLLGNIAGFQGGVYSAVDLYVKAEDVKAVEKIILDYKIR